MKLIADEHVSPRIVRAVCEIALRRDWTFSGIIGSALRSREDEDWIDSFADGGGNVILSADRAMLRRPTLIERISSRGLVGIYLPAEWASAKRQYQAAHILYWWPTIEDTIQKSAPGAAWIVPKGFNSGELRVYVAKAAQGQSQEKAAGA